MNAISLKDFQKNGKNIHWPCISFDGIKREGRWSVYWNLWGFHGCVCDFIIGQNHYKINKKIHFIAA